MKYIYNCFFIFFQVRMKRRLMDSFKIATYFRVPFYYIRRSLLLTLFWATVYYLFFYYTRSEEHITYDTPNLGRELLQQDPADYVHDSTTSLQVNKKSILDVKLNIDNGPNLSEKERLKILSKNSNLPLSYWAETKSAKSTSSNCLKFPSLFDLDFNNVYWQRLSAFNSTFYLFGAYYDNRARVGTLPLVRILGMVDKIQPPPTYCQFWYDNVTKSSVAEASMFSKASYTYMWYSKWGNYKDDILQPFIISCTVPKIANASAVPASVSLVGKQCEKPTNNLKVIYKKPKKKEDFAVCVKGLDFLYEDISVRLVEWLELLNILGAKKIFLYELEVHPNISKVLSHYVKSGLVEVTPLTLPGEQPNLPGFRHLYLKSKLVTKRQNELIPYNDCLYKNLHSYDYIALLDTDEVIMPLVHDNWKDMMAEVLDLALKEKNYTRASYNFRNVYFLDDLQDGKEMTHITHEEGIPRYLHMLNHVYRSKNYTKPGLFVKCFHNTDRVVSLHNHFPMNCFGQCTTYSVNTSLAHMQHYRKDCVDPLKKSCNEFRNFTMRDTSIWRFKDDLIRRTTETLYHLGFFKDFNVSARR